MDNWRIFKPRLPVSLPITTQTSLFNKTGLWRYASPRYVQRTPPCQVGCPAGHDIRDYLRLIREDRIKEASELIRTKSPIPSTCGRVCYRPCEDVCNRVEFDEPLAIREIERFLGDYGLTSPLPNIEKARKGQKAAIVGSGPAGLTCAWRLRQLAYEVTIFEAGSVPGGMLVTAIPEYRLPRAIIEKEIGLIISLGVEIVTGVRIGRDLGLDDLFGRGYKAIFLAIGAQESQKLHVVGEEGDGVIGGLEFLREAKQGKKPKLGEQVAVIGGGNVAIDAARTALRLGTKQVTILYRRSSEEMPASEEEVESAQVEGVRIQYLVSPIEVIRSNGKLGGLRLVRMELAEPDASGRRRPVPIKGSEFNIQVDSVVTAIGQAVDSSLLGEESGIQTSDNGLLVAAPDTLATSRPGVFAGGDGVTGPASVVHAIAAGKKAATSIDRYLKGKPSGVPATEEKPVAFEELNMAYFKPGRRVLTREVSSSQRLKGFSEVQLGYNEEEVLGEVERCFSCGLCTACDNCWLMCPDVAVSRESGGYTIDYEYCKGCGICVKECPTSAIVMEAEA